MQQPQGRWVLSGRWGRLPVPWAPLAPRDLWLRFLLSGLSVPLARLLRQGLSAPGLLWGRWDLPLRPRLSVQPAQLVRFLQWDLSAPVLLWVRWDPSPRSLPSGMPGIPPPFP